MGGCGLRFSLLNVSFFYVLGYLLVSFVWVRNRCMTIVGGYGSSVSFS